AASNVQSCEIFLTCFCLVSWRFDSAAYAATLGANGVGWSLPFLQLLPPREQFEQPRLDLGEPEIGCLDLCRIRAVQIGIGELPAELCLLLLERLDQPRQRLQFLRLLVAQPGLACNADGQRTLRYLGRLGRLPFACAHNAGPLFVAAGVFDPARVAIECDHL